MGSGLHLRRIFTTTALGTRSARVALLFLTWLLAREASLRTSGFENGPIVCPIRLLTGYPCPGCGGTRSMGAISVGQFENAWSLNPIAFAVCVIAILWAVQIRPVNDLARRASSFFRSKPIALQILPLLTLYAIAWIAAIDRFNSGIF